MDQFTQICKQAGLAAHDWTVINGKEHISLEGMKKLRDWFIANGDMERARVVNQIVSPYVKKKGGKR